VAHPVLESALLIGGIIAIFIAIIGRSEKTSKDEIALFLGFIVGAIMIFLGIVLYSEAGWETPSTVIVLVLLGLGLFFRVFKKVKWAAVISLIVGIAVGYGLYLLSKAILTSLLTPTVIIVLAVIVMFIVYFILKFLEDIVDFVGAVVSFRPILFIAGIVAVLEGVLLLLGNSLSAILA